MLKRLGKNLVVGAAILAAHGARAEALPLRPGAVAYADANGEALRNPEGVACTDSGRLVLADSGNGRLVPYTFKDGALAAGDVIRFAELGNPVRVQIDSRGNVLALDRKERRIVRVNEKGGFGGIVQPSGVPPANGFFPVSFKLDGADNLYVLDAGSSRVVVLAPSGAFVRQIPAPAGSLLTDVAVDAKGTLFATDAAHAQVLSAAKNAASFTAIGRSLRDAMSFPTYLTVTAQGLIVVVDRNGNGLVLVGPDGSYLGRRLAIGWTEGFVYYPGQICVDAHGDAFVADRANQRLQVFTEAK
jgi:DNA-binding beta-propeller fold protein YncE